MQGRAGESTYGIVDLNAANFEEYGAFCLKSKKNSEGYINKVKWMKERFKEGLRTKLLLVKEKSGFTSRGFVEYIPGEYAWRGINAKGYMVIHCIWVVGRSRDNGYGTELLRQCEKDAREMNGLAVVTSDKHWLPGDGLFLKHGFKKADTMASYLDLLVKRFSDDASLPKFNPIPDQRLERYKSGITILKSDQCPYTADSLKEIGEVAEEKGIPPRVEQIRNCREAQNSVHPYGTYCVLMNGKVVTYRPIGKKRMNELIAASSEAT